MVRIRWWKVACVLLWSILLLLWRVFVETLYDIIYQAADYPDKTSRALFDACDKWVDDRGLQPRDSAILYRFLSYLQHQERPGEDFLKRFQRVLRDSFEITINYGDDPEDVDAAPAPDATRQGAPPNMGRHTRTGSFDSFLDGTADRIAGNDYGDLAVRPRGASQQGAPNGYDSKRNRPRATSDTEAHSYHQAGLPVRNRVNGIAPRRATSASQQQRQSIHKRSTSVSSRGSLQIRRDGPPATYRPVDHDADEGSFTDHTTSLDLSHVQIPGVNAPIPKGPYRPAAQPSLSPPHQQQQQQRQYVFEPFRPSDTRLMDDAETFEQQRLHRVTRECIRIWRNRAQGRIDMRDDMERAAIAFERRILLKASFLQLRETALVRRSGRETNRFFDRLETRADKARSLFLLTKAFTHWAKCAEDEVQRTSVARRHILRTRFFNGWRDITAVNELKIQQFALGKFLSIWRARAAAVRDAQQFADSYYEDKIVRRTWDALNNEYLSRGASNWHDKRTARTTLQKWREIAEIMRERGTWATDRRDGMLLRKTFQTWQQKSQAAQALQSQADDFRQTSILRTAFRTIQKQVQLEPLLRQVQTRVNGRLIRTVFQNWQKDAQLLRKARIVDRLRLLRNTYTAWNDKLRIKALEDRINERVIVECLYKWTLASRVSLFQRVHDRQLKESTFLSWVTKTNQRANTLDAAERRFAQFKRAQLLRTCLRKMETITAEKRREQFAIVAEYQQKLKQRIFDKLKERKAHFEQLNQWSTDAHFYVLSKHTLKTWSEATQLARRNRRRDAYSQVRRAVKTNLVRRVFGHWRAKADHIAALTQRANDMLETRTMQASAAILHQWHDRTLILGQQNAQAANIHAFKVTSTYFSIWSQRIDDIRMLEAQAAALLQESTEIAATGALKKMGWRLWNFQRQEDNARALFDRNFEKHVRAMVRFWAERATERSAERAASPTPRRRLREQRDSDGTREKDGDSVVDGGNTNANEESGDETQRLEAWTAFDDNALGLTSNLDLSLSLTPQHSPRRRGGQSTQTPKPYTQTATPLSSRTTARTPAPPFFLPRPNTYPQPDSAVRPPPPQPSTIFEDDESDLDFGDAPDADVDAAGGGAGPWTFWAAGTPLPPPSTTAPPTASTRKPGYLKTPSKRSLARAKHPQLHASPDKDPQPRGISPMRRPLQHSRLGRVLEREGTARGSMSAPPVRSARPEIGGGLGGQGGRGGGVTSFERRLRDGGFGGSVAVGRSTGGGNVLGSAMKRGIARGKGTGTGTGTVTGGAGGGGRARVEFGNVSQMG
ncbi:Sfi1-domain-containing protein [Stemphylium lycopersici]|nr:hypothetical protein TW65_04824 [Stemphylium lycopersici]RAR03163.1 Sfi1-domain-containing protein [Stemphylium lycopersici]